MTPQERQLIDDLFGRLASLESAPRDADASRAIADGVRRAPNAIYALVQTVLLQDEALRRANDRIEELEGRGQDRDQQSGSFLDSMRGSLFGGSSAPRGSVPNVRPSEGNRAAWNTGGTGVFDRGAPPPLPGTQQGAPQPQGGGAGSFLGTAAAAAAGVVGGSLLLNSIRGMMGGSGQQGFGDQAGLGGAKDTPWGGSKDQSNSDLARDAGIDNIGKSGQDASQDQRAGLFDDKTQTADNSDYASDDDDDDGFDGDDGDDGGEF